MEMKLFSRNEGHVSRLKWPTQCPAQWMNIDLGQAYWAKGEFQKLPEIKIRAQNKNQ